MKIAFFCNASLGDSLIYLNFVNNLALNDHQVDFYHSVLHTFDEWIINKNNLSLKSINKVSKILIYDLIIIRDNAEKENKWLYYSLNKIRPSYKIITLHNKINIKKIVIEQSLYKEARFYLSDTEYLF